MSQKSEVQHRPLLPDLPELPHPDLPERRRSRPIHRLPLALTAALLCAVAVSGCGPQQNSSATTSTSAAPAATATSTSAVPTKTARTTVLQEIDPSTTKAATVSVPDVRGERPARAQQLLTAAGLRATISGGSGRGEGGGQCVITTQDPAGGNKVASGTTITLGTGAAGGGSC